MAAKVLVLEDEIGIRSFVSLNLKREGYEVIEASSGEEAIELIKENNLSIALLDVMLPGISGFDVCKFLRKNYPSTRVIMLTAKGMESDKIIGLNYGADDYVVKPFSVKELMARVNAMARRLNEDKKQINNKMMQSDNFIIDTKKRKVFKGDIEFDLTPTEYAIIHLLISHKGDALSRNEILDKVWGNDYVGDYKIVDVNIRRIRSKIEGNPSKPEYIKTIWGYGYSWRKEE